MLRVDSSQVWMSQSTKLNERSTWHALSSEVPQDAHYQWSKQLFLDPEKERVGPSGLTNGPLTTCKLAVLVGLYCISLICTQHVFN